MKADLHMHSIYSDGKLTIDQLIERIEQAKLDVVALTDHDTIFGVKEYKEKLEKKGVIVVAGLELSTKYNGESIHVLGYFKDIEAMGTEFREYLETMHSVRYSRLRQMVENVNRIYGFNIDFDQIAKEHPFMLERSHLSDAIEKITGEERQVIFKKYIGDTSPAYVPVAKITPIDGVDMIHKAGGYAFMAHPYSYKNAIKILDETPFDGIEVFYGPAKGDETNYKKYYNYAKEHNLLISGGSDFHQDNDMKHSSIGTAEYYSPYIEEVLDRIGIKR